MTDEIDRLWAGSRKMAETALAEDKRHNVEMQKLRVVLQAEIERLRATVWEENHMNDSLRREIERLRAQTDTRIKDQVIAKHVDTFMKQNAEIERLRAAVKEWKAKYEGLNRWSGDMP